MSEEVCAICDLWVETGTLRCPVHRPHEYSGARALMAAEVRQFRQPVIGVKCRIGDHAECAYEGCECETLRMDKRGALCRTIHEGA